MCNCRCRRIGAKFTGDPLAGDFMALVDATTLTMNRYQTL
jgi:hypothetical protein